MLAALFAFIEVVISIIFDAIKKFVAVVLFTALGVVALFIGAIITLIYILT